MITRYPVVKLHVSDYVSNSIWTEKRTIWQSDKHQGRQARIYESAGGLECTQNEAFSLKTE